MHQDSKTLIDFLARLQSVRNDEDQMFQCHQAITINDETCISCKLPIEEECITFNAFHWHEKCFACSACQKDFSETPELAYVDTANGAIRCKTHALTNAVQGSQKIRHLKQYITLLCNALHRLFEILKIDEKEFKPEEEAVPQGLVQELSSEDMRPKKEEFFDDEEGDRDQSGRVASFRRRGQDMVRYVGQGTEEKYHFITDISGLQSLASRQTAALALHHHLEKWFTLEKILEIADGPKRTIWSKMFGKGKNNQKKKIGIIN